MRTEQETGRSLPATFEHTENCGILALSLLGNPVKDNVFSGNIFSRMGDYAIAFSRFEDGPCEISNNIVMGNVARDTQLRLLDTLSE